MDFLSILQKTKNNTFSISLTKLIILKITFQSRYNQKIENYFIFNIINNITNKYSLIKS